MTNQTPDHNLDKSRRTWLKGCGIGFGAMALADLLSISASANPNEGVRIPARAKRAIFLFMSGGPSQIDLFDPKPALQQHDGKPLPFEQPKLVRTPTINAFASPYRFQKHGKSGIEISGLLPEIATCADDLCVIRSMVADNINHNGACLQMNTGEQSFSRPSLGSWLLYGLGTENRNLPGFVVISPFQPAQGAPLWSSSFLPASMQGTLVSNMREPLANLAKTDLEISRQRVRLDALKKLNEVHLRERSEDASRLEARIESFELAYRMQKEAPEAFRVEDETLATTELYGLNDPATETFGKQCLLARRLVERGVRFVQVYHTQTKQRSSCQLWDQHADLATELPNNCRATDRPVAGLIKDLKNRGLLDETLVIWGGEFGRTPTAEGRNGREHHPFGFTMFLAGGGVRGGVAYGATDEFGWHAVDKRVHVHDLHATLLHLMGLDHEQLTYPYSGRNYRLTDVYGNVIHDILA